MAMNQRIMTAALHNMNEGVKESLEFMKNKRFLQRKNLTLTQ